MPIQSLGIFDAVFEWVCDKIFNPIIEWLGNILSSIFSWLVQNVVLPLLKPVFSFLWDIVIVNVLDILCTIMYTVYCTFLNILDQLQAGFDILIGLKNVSYYSESVGGYTEGTLLEYFLENSIVRTAVISITFIALALSMIFAIYSVMRSTLDFDFEGKRPVGKVLNAVAKTMIAFLLVPLIALVGVKLASVVLQQACAAIAGEDVTIGRWILVISSLNAGIDGEKFTDINSSPWSLLLDETKPISYYKFGEYIHVSMVDYLLGYAAVIFASVIFIMCLFTFIKRIFEIVILYITSPYFVSTIVLDDGEKFKRWTETFIAKIVVGFGSAIGLRVFMMMVPIIMSDDLQIFDSFVGDLVGGYIIRLVFILGGMYAVYKSSNLLTGIISSSVAADENASNALTAGLLTAGAGKMAGAVSRATKEGASKRAAKKAAKGSAAKDKKFKGDPTKFDFDSYNKGFKSSFTGSLGLKEDQIFDDYMSEDARKEKEAEDAMNALGPLGAIDQFKDLKIDEDYESHEFEDGEKVPVTMLDGKGIDFHVGEEGLLSKEISAERELSKTSVPTSEIDDIKLDFKEDYDPLKNETGNETDASRATDRFFGKLSEKGKAADPMRVVKGKAAALDKVETDPAKNGIKHFTEEGKLSADIEKQRESSSSSVPLSGLDLGDFSFNEDYSSEGQGDESRFGEMFEVGDHNLFGDLQSVHYDEDGNTAPTDDEGKQRMAEIEAAKPEFTDDAIRRSGDQKIPETLSRFSEGISSLDSALDSLTGDYKPIADKESRVRKKPATSAAAKTETKAFTNPEPVVDIKSTTEIAKKDPPPDKP